MWRVALGLLVAGCGRLAFDHTVDGGDGDVADRDGTTDSMIPPGAVLWLPMDDAPPNIVDRAGGHVPGCTPPGECPTLVAGHRDRGYRFGGTTNSYIFVPFSADLSAAPGYTAATWINLESYRSGQGYNCILSKPLNGGDFDSYSMCIQDDSLALFYSANASTPDFLLGPTVPLNSWHHLAMTWDGTTKRGYFDGAKVNEIATLVASDTSNLLIGADNNSGAPVYQIQGALDDVMIWQRALTDTEIATLAQ